jgi:hypothetical protein
VPKCPGRPCTTFSRLVHAAARRRPFERQARLDAVLANPDGPDLERYLPAGLDDDL